MVNSFQVMLLHFLLKFSLLYLCCALEDTIKKLHNAQRVGIIQNGQYPYMAALEIKGNFSCGAVIIRPNVVLTAAHCTKCQHPVDIKIRAGTLTKYEKEGINSTVQVRVVRAFVIHERFNLAGHNEYDISLVWLKKNFILTNFVNVIELVPKTIKYTSFIGELGLTLGWGENENGTEPDHLYSANLIISNKTSCKVIRDYNREFTKSMLCLLSSSSRSESGCNGDSGGPLIVRINGVDVLFGITSFGYIYDDTFECIPSGGTVFTDVAFLRTWIDSWLDYDIWK